MKKVFSFFKNAGMGAKASPTSEATGSSTSGAKASPNNGAKVPPTNQGCSDKEARRPNFRDDDMNAIHLAARDGSEWRVKQILSFRKIDLNSRDKRHRTALHVACAYGRPRMVRLLIERRCLLDLRDREKKTALIQALQYQNVKCASLLLDYSADPNVMDNDGNTALHYAVLGHNKAIVEKLLAHKANTELKNKRDLTPLALAKRANNDEMVKLLERRAIKDDPRKWKQPVIYEYKEERRPQTLQSSNLAFTPIATNLQESTKSAQTKTKSKTVDEIAAEGSLNSKQQLTSEYKEGKKPPKSEGSNLAFTPIATNLQEATKSAQTKTKSKTVDEIAAEGSLNSKQQLTSEYKEGKKPPKSEGSNLAFTPIATNLQEATKSAQTKTKSKTAFTPIATNLQESTKSAQTKTKSKTVDEIAAEGSLNSKQQLTSEYKEGKKPPKSEGSNLATDLQESPKSAQTKTKSKTVDKISAEGSLNRKKQPTSEYEQGRTQTLESSLFVEDMSEEDSLSRKQQLTSEYEQGRTQALESSLLVEDMSEEDSLRRKKQLTSEYEQGRTQALDDSLFVPDARNLCKGPGPHSPGGLPQPSQPQRCPEGLPGRTSVEDISAEDALSSKQQLTSEYQERRRPHTSESTHRVIDLRHTQKQAWTERKSNTVFESSEKDSLSSLSRKSGIDDAWPTSHNEDVKDKVISKTCILTAKTSENQSKQIHHPPLHLEKMSQESEINRACDEEDTSAYSGHPSMQKEEEMGIKQGALEQRKKLQLYEDKSKQRSHEFSVKFKMTECPEEEPLRDNSKEGASLRQMPSNLTSKMLDCERKDAFEMSVSAALQTFPEGEETSLKIVSPSHADPGSSKDSPSSSSSELRLREKELHSENGHKPEAEHVLNKNEESFYNDTENKKERHAVVTSEVREDQEFAMQMTKNMNPNTTDWKLGMGPTPQSRDLKSHLELQRPWCTETKLITEIKSHDMSAVTNTYKETKPNQDLFQKPLLADNCSANYCKSMDSKLKDESSSVLHNDRTRGVYVNEELQKFINKVDILKAEHLAWKREKIQPQKEVEEKKKQKSSKREVSRNMDDRADKDSGSIGLSQQSNEEHTDNQRPKDKINENTVIFMNKVEEKKEQKSSKRKVSRNMNDRADKDTGSIGLSQQSNKEHTYSQRSKDKINENTVIFMNKVEEKKEQKSSKRKVSRNMDDRADKDSGSIGLSQQSNKEHTDNQRPKDKINENTVIFMNKVEEKKEQKNNKREVSRNMGDRADKDTGSIGLSQQSNNEHTYNQRPNDKINENTVIFMNKVEEKKEQKSSKRKVSRNMDDRADKDSGSIGLSQQSNKEHTDNQRPKDKINENTVIFMNKVEEKKEQKNNKREVSRNMGDRADKDTGSIGLSQQSNKEHTYNQRPNDKINENTVIFMNKVEEKKEQKSSKREVSGNMGDRADKDSGSIGLSQQSNKEHTYNQRPNDKINENTVIFMNKVEEKKEQKNNKREVSRNMGDRADKDTGSIGLSQQSNKEHTYNQRPNDKINENTVIFMNKVEEKKEQKSSKREVSGNMGDRADKDTGSIGLSQQSNNEHTYNQRPNDKINENTVIFMNKVEEKKEQKSSKRKVSRNMDDRADKDSGSIGLSQQSNKEHTDNQRPKDKINENTVIFMNKVEEKKEQKNNKREVSRNMGDRADKDTGSIGLSQQSNKEHTYNQRPNDKINENTVIFMNKVEEKKEQKSSKREVSGNTDDGADDNRDSTGLSQQSNSEQSDEMSESTVMFVKKVEEKKDQKTSKREVSGNMDEVADDSGSGGMSQQNNSEQTDKQQVSIMENEESDRLCSKPGIGDSRPISHNEDLKDKVISKTCILTAKTSENQNKQINRPPLHLEKMSQESEINRACDKEDTSAYSGHPSVQKEEEMGIKQGTLEQRKNLQLYEDGSKQRSHEFSVKFKMTECPEEEPLRDNSKEGASLRQMPSNLTSKMLDCEGKDAFEMSVSAALQTFPEGEETSLKIVSPSHADPGSSKDSPSSSSSELRLREKELHSENGHKPEAEHVLNKNEESFYNDTENKKERHAVVTSEVREDQEFAMQMTKNMNPNTTDWKLGMGPTPQSRDLKSHLELQRPWCTETKLITEIKSHDMSAVTNTYKETKPNQDLFQKPLLADNCSANYCKSMDSKLKDESSSVLHNDRTRGVYVNEELQKFINKVDIFKAEHLAWKREKIQPQKEVEEEKKQKSTERKVSGNMYNAAADDSDGRSQKNKVEQTDKQQLPVMGSEDSARSTLREEKEKRRKADLLREKNRVQLRKKEEHSIKEVEMNPQLETTIGTQAITLEIIGENEVSESSGEEKSLLHGNQMLWDEIAKLRLEIGTIKNQTQEMGKKCFEEIATVKEKNDCLEKTIRKTVFQHNAELEVLRAELIMLNSKLEDEQQNRGRLEAEVESYRPRLATAVQDHEHRQTSKGDPQLTFQRPRDEWFCLWDKMNSDMSNLKHNNEILSQQLSKLETKINSLEIELHHTRDALNERTLVLERDLIQKQCQKEKTEYVYQKEQGKVDKDIGKQESLQERLSHLQSEAMLLKQQLDQAHNKVDREEKTVINIQDPISAIIKIFDDESENYGLMLNEMIKNLINEWHHFKERIHQCENDHVERDAIVKQLQQELADRKTKLSTIEFFSEIESGHHMHLEDKKQDFKNKLDQSRSQNDELIARLQRSSSTCIRLYEEKTLQQELSMEALLKRREELKRGKKKWERRAENLVTQMNMHMEEDCVGEKHELKIEETAKIVGDNVTQLNLFLQTQRASQETSEY